MLWKKSEEALGETVYGKCGSFLYRAFVLSAVFSATHAEQGDRREMLSMPIQQMARCMIYHGGVGVLPEDDGTMSEQDRALVNDLYWMRLTGIMIPASRIR